MKIHSSFKDYYDSIAFTGGLRNTDPLEKRYIREESRHKFEGHPLEAWGTDYQTEYTRYFGKSPSQGSYAVMRSFDTHTNSSNGIPTTHTFSGFTLFVAGKRYPGVHIYSPRVTSTSHIFSEEQLDETLKILGISTNHYDFAMYREHLQSSREPQGLRDAMVNAGIAIAVLERDDACGRDLIFTHNTSLKKYEATKILDPYTAFQEISLWIDGALSEPEAPAPLADKVRIQQHGFDLKTSFRKAKGE